MDRKTFDDLIKNNFDMRVDLSRKKSKDYATDDVLSNFKRLSSAAKALDIDVHTPIGYTQFLLLMKVDRINNVLKNSKTGPVNESILDSFRDAANYLDLSLGLYLEGEDL